jgi:hypothetical protein
MLAVVRRFADEARADGRGLNRVGMVLHECFGRPERLDDAFRDWAGSIASVVLAAAEPCPDDLAALRAFDELAPLRVGASLAAVAAPFETADAPRWADARRAVLASRPVPGFPTGRPAATRTVARIDAMSRDWPGAGASAAIVTWTTVLGPRDTAIRLRWDATVPARLCHPGGDLAIVPGNRPASVEIDLPAGGPVDIRIVAAIGRDASSVRLRWQRPGAKGWSAGDDRMPGGAPWTEAVHPVAELPDGRHVIAAATARPWDPAAITEAARCAYANGRNEEAWLHASHLVALPGIGPSQIADLADAIGAWPGSERVLDDPGLPPLVVTTAFLRAGRPDLAIAAGRRAATMEGVYRHSRDTREAVDLAVRLALDAGLHQEVLAWIPAFMADSEAQPADMSLGREPMEALREIVLAASAASGAFDAAAVLRRLTTEDPDSGGRRRVHPELELAVRRSGDAACIRELGGSGRPVYGSWPSILALVRAQVDAGNLDQAGRTLKSLEDGHLTRIPNGIDDLHGMLLVQAVRLWNGKDPTRPHPERRILDGAQLTPAMQLALDVIDGRTTVDAADALIRTKGLLDAILPVAIVAWRRDRAAIARNLVELVTDARSDPAIGARNLRSHLPGVDREQPSGF